VAPPARNLPNPAGASCQRATHVRNQNQASECRCLQNSDQPARPFSRRMMAVDGSSAAVMAARFVHPTDETELRDRAVRAFERAFNPQGVARQLAAAITTPDRTADLRLLDLPTLVIHGTEDPVIALGGGQATAEAIPGAELVVIDGMGHDLPRPLWPTVAERIAALVARAQQRPRSTSTPVS
jgi:pimeloyl-ACP methyl ester carboxylesterase